MATYIPYETTVEYYDTQHKLVKSERHQPLHNFTEVITCAVNPKEEEFTEKETVITADNQQEEVIINKIKTTMVPNRTEFLTTDNKGQLISKVTRTLTDAGWERVSEYPEGVVVKQIKRHFSTIKDGHRCMVIELDTMEFNKHDPENVLVCGGSRETIETITVPSRLKELDTVHRYITSSKVADSEQIDPERMEIRPTAEFCDMEKSYINTTQDAAYGWKLAEFETKAPYDDLVPFRDSKYARLNARHAYQDKNMVRKSYENMLKSFFEGESPEIKHDETFDPELFQIDWSEVDHMDLQATRACVLTGVVPQLTCIEIGCDELIRITVNLSYDKNHRTPHYQYHPTKVDITVRKFACSNPDDYGVYRVVTEKYSYVPTQKSEFGHSDLELLALSIERLAREQWEKIKDNAKHDERISDIMDRLQVKFES
mgnify:FL=1